MAYSYEWAKKKFLEIANVKDGTYVYQVKSKRLNNLKTIKELVGEYPPNSVFWQHTDNYHIAVIEIAAGHGQDFNRILLDLVHSGVDTERKFQNAWIKRNGSLRDGVFPHAKSSITSSQRAKQASLITVNRNYPPNPNSQIPDILTEGSIHRTHLISAQTTGVENNKGLLIDFDGWLNVKPLNDFEREILEYSKRHTIIWTAQIWPDHKGMHFRYVIYNKDWSIYRTKEWIDDRWTYEWAIGEV